MLAILTNWYVSNTSICGSRLAANATRSAVVSPLGDVPLMVLKSWLKFTSRPKLGPAICSRPFKRRKLSNTYTVSARTRLVSPLKFTAMDLRVVAVLVIWFRTSRSGDTPRSRLSARVLEPASVVSGRTPALTSYATARANANANCPEPPSPTSARAKLPEFRTNVVSRKPNSALVTMMPENGCSSWVSTPHRRETMASVSAASDLEPTSACSQKKWSSGVTGQPVVALIASLSFSHRTLPRREKRLLCPGVGVVEYTAITSPLPPVAQFPPRHTAPTNSGRSSKRYSVISGWSCPLWGSVTVRTVCTPYDGSGCRRRCWRRLTSTMEKSVPPELATITVSALAPVTVSLGHRAIPHGREPTGMAVLKDVSPIEKISNRLRSILVRYTSFRFRL